MLFLSHKNVGRLAVQGFQLFPSIYGSDMISKFMPLASTHLNPSQNTEEVTMKQFYIYILCKNATNEDIINSKLEVATPSSRIT